MLNNYRVKKALTYIMPRNVTRFTNNTIHSTFDQYKCIFIHIPKAAGSSISLSLFGHQVGHRSLKEYYLAAPAKVEKYFVFTFVRNPWSRFYSSYKFLQKGGMTKKDALFAKEYLNENETFEQFAEKVLDLKLYEKVNHLKPQNSFIVWDNVNVGVNFIGRFEDVEKDYLKVAGKIGVEGALQHSNRTNDKAKDTWKTSYNDKTKQIVNEIYYKDIYLFGYDFGEKL